MKRITIALLALACLAAAPAAAQLDPTVDTVCIVFDTASLSNCEIVAPYTSVTAYVVLLGASAPDLSGWELSLDINPMPGIPPTYNPPPGIIPIIWGPPDFVIAYSTPQPWMEVQVLMSVVVMPMNTNPLYFSVGPIAATCASPPAPAYYTGSGYQCMPMEACTMPGTPVACINCDCEEVIGVEPESWGAVKSLYR